MAKACIRCGNVADDSADFCPKCGTSFESMKQGEDVVSIWTYVWMTIVFSMPVVGLIISIIMAFAPQKSRNLTNFARAYMIIDISITLLLVVLGALAALLISTVVGPLSDWVNELLDKLMRF